MGMWFVIGVWAALVVGGVAISTVRGLRRAAETFDAALADVAEPPRLNDRVAADQAERGEQPCR